MEGQRRREGGTEGGRDGGRRDGGREGWRGEKMEGGRERGKEGDFERLAVNKSSVITHERSSDMCGPVQRRTAE